MKRPAAMQRGPSRLGARLHCRLVRELTLDFVDSYLQVLLPVADSLLAVLPFAERGDVEFRTLDDTLGRCCLERRHDLGALDVGLADPAAAVAADEQHL